MPPPSNANNFFGPRFFRRSCKETLLRVEWSAMLTLRARRRPFTIILEALRHRI